MKSVLHVKAGKASAAKQDMREIGRLGGLVCTPKGVAKLSPSRRREIAILGGKATQAKYAKMRSQLS